jgi:uncharacterized membrane protein YvbJ
MALIACPECSHQVSDKAVACPKCGHPIAGVQTPQQLQISHKQEDSLSKAFNEQLGKQAAEGTSNLIGCLFMIGIAVVIGGCFFR